MAIVISAALFSGAHFLRRHRETWAAIGLFVLGVQLGVAYVVTRSLWLPMGLHSGGVLAIQIHRLLVDRYRGPAWLIGTKDFPVAGAATIALMLAVTVGMWHFLR
jgi:membrane protease YdiL (CAAX protease family)